MNQEQGFLQFVRRRMQEEARELDAAKVMLRIEGGGLLVVSQQQTIGGRLRTWEASHSIGIDTKRLD